MAVSLKKFIYLFLTVCLTAVSSTFAGDPNDPGQPDTIWLDCGTKAVPDTGGWVAFSIYLKTDNQGDDSAIVALDLPLYLSSTNPLDSATIDTTVSRVYANSAFKDSSWDLAVSADSLALDGRVGLGAINYGEGGLVNGTFTVAQLWIHLSDSTNISIDTASRGSNTLLLVTSLAAGYVPIWNNTTCPVCVATSLPGDANGLPPITTADIVYLVNYVFDKDRPAASCVDPDPGTCWPIEPICKGEVNGVPPITTADIVYLVNYVFDKDRPAQSCLGSDQESCWAPVGTDVCCFPML